MCDDPEVGGQGMPKTVGTAALEYMVGANSAFMLYFGMTHGAAKLVEAFGDKTQKRLYMKKNVFRGNGAAPCCSPNRKPAPMSGL